MLTAIRPVGVQLTLGLHASLLHDMCVRKTSLAAPSAPLRLRSFSLTQTICAKMVFGASCRA